MLRSQVLGSLNTVLAGVGQAMLFILCGMYSHFTAEAAGQAPSAERPEQTSFIVYLHPVASDMEILVNGLPVYQTGSVFGVWCYQFNVTSFLDTKPKRVEIRTQPGNNDAAYCDVEVWKIAGTQATPTILAKKTLRAADLEDWNKWLTVVTLDLALPEQSPRPLWVETLDTDLGPVFRDTPAALLKEVFTALQRGDVESLMALIDPALTNQAMMEGAPSDLLKQAMRSKLLRYCIPNIHVTETLQDFRDQNYTDRMAPLDVQNLRYACMKEPGSEDKNGNIYLPVEPIQFLTKKNRLFAARVFLSCTNDESNRWYVSRFFFDRVE